MIINIQSHRVQHGDIMDGISELMKQEKADFIYTDPPWSNTMKYWHTLNFKHTGKITKSVGYNEFMENFFSILKYYAEDRILLEYGQRSRNDIISLCNKYNLIHNETVQAFYKSSNKYLPFDLHFITKKTKFTVTDDMRETCRTHIGLNLVREIFKFYCPTTARFILDPFCGMGYTAQIAKENNKIFRGNELNKKRLEKTIHRLAI